jgi:uncharacterized protein (TIGR03083 family)
MKPLETVLTVHLFPEERKCFLGPLASLTPPQWDAPTVCPGWSVKDIAAHLLADDLGRLARGRDKHAPAAFAPNNVAQGPSPDEIQARLLDFINRQNETWAAAARRLSPRLMIDLLRWSGEQTQAYFESLDMFAMGKPVTWAGPEPAPVWLDIAREYTERWIHQSQVRDAVGAPALTEPRLFLPLLDTLVRALPHTFLDTEAPEGTHVRLEIGGVGAQGLAPLQWSLVREGPRWALFDICPAEPAATVRMDADTAWRLFTKGISKAEALACVRIEGDAGVGEKILDTVSIIA